MKIEKDNNELVVRVPLKCKRHSGEEMDNIAALYEDDNINGLAYRIDMSYKRKPDQFTDFFLRVDLPKKELEEIAKKLDIETFYYED